MSGLSHRVGRDRRAPGKGASAPATPQTIFGSALSLWLEYTLGIVLGAPPRVATWNDQSGNANNASQGTALIQPTITATGVDFDPALTQHMIAADSATLDATTALTIVVEVTPDVVTGNRVPVGKSSNAAGAWSLQTNLTDCRCHIGNPGTAVGIATPIFAAATRVVVVWVYDGTQATNATRLVCYKDGVAQSLSFVGTIPATIPVTANTLGLGAYTDPTQYLDGRERLVTLANVAATPAQVAAITAYAQAIP